jgi:hypothetical protein
LAPMIPVSRGYCIAGLVLWIPVAIWWLALPHLPALVLGSAAKHLEFAPSWHRFYLPMLLLILASISQRVINLFRPNWTWLVPSMRTIINAAAVPVLYYLVFQSHPVFAVSPGQDPLQFGKLAEDLNNFFTWGVLGPWLWLYAGFSAPVYFYYWLPYLRRWFGGSNSTSTAATGVGKDLPKGLLL